MRLGLIYRREKKYEYFYGYIVVVLYITHKYPERGRQKKSDRCVVVFIIIVVSYSIVNSIINSRIGKK